MRGTFRAEGIGHWTLLVHVEDKVQQPRSRAHGPAAETFGEVLEAWIAGAGDACPGRRFGSTRPVAALAESCGHVRSVGGVA